MLFNNPKIDWKTAKFGSLVSFKTTNSYSRDNLNYELGVVKNIHYGDIHTKFQTLFDITNEDVPYINKEINIDKISAENYCLEGDMIFADASEDLNDVGKSIEIFELNNEKILSGLHTILARPNKGIFHKGFLGYAFKSENVRNQIKKESQGSKVLSINAGRLSKIEINYPDIVEQKKIADFFLLIDKKIQTQKKTIETIKSLKISMSKKILSQGIRLKNIDGNHFSDWDYVKLGDLLDYEQPTNYLVSSTEYDNSYQTPVLTAGKTFILGYTNEKHGIFDEKKLPVIIFDDFTTASQYVTFPFKAKSSAMKILAAKNGHNIKYIFEAMQQINYEIGGHGRHWISVFSDIEIPIPSIQEQSKIANFLNAFDKKIQLEAEILSKLEEQKRYFLQNLFV